MEKAVKVLNAPSIIKEAMSYSLQAGGKRIRPLLLFAVLDALGKSPDNGLSTACSLEMLHTYSLIHDDLPSMDDDDVRRGRPTNHKVYGEAFAILAGDALLTYSFQLISEDPELSDAVKVKLIGELSASAGPEGMVGGQVSDLLGENKQLGLEELESIHHRKTGKLLMFAVLAGAIIGEADNRQINELQSFAGHLGLAFQIRDDILDVEGDAAKLGKPVGSDTGNHKSTYPSLLTMAGAKLHLEHQIEMAKAALTRSGVDSALLLELTDIVALRDS